MTTEQIKAKIAKKEAKIAELKMQLAGAALQNLGKAIADHLKNQPQPKESASGGYVQKEGERVINPVSPMLFPTRVELLEKNHNSLYNWTTDKVKSIEDRLDKIEMVMPHIEWTLEDVEGVDTGKLRNDSPFHRMERHIYTNSTGSAKSCKTDQCNVKDEYAELLEEIRSQNMGWERVDDGFSTTIIFKAPSCGNKF